MFRLRAAVSIMVRVNRTVQGEPSAGYSYAKRLHSDGDKTTQRDLTICL